MKQPQIMRQAETETGADTESDTAPASKRKAVSKRLLVDASGATEGDELRQETAVGAIYRVLDPAGNHDIAYTFGQNPSFDRMCALFGFHTKVGNVANTVLNDKDEPGGPAEAAAAIREWLAGAQAPEPVWAERAAGGVGARIDKDALAGAIVSVAQSLNDAKWQARLASHNGNTDAASGELYSEVRARLEAEPTYVRMARQVPAVASEYASRVGKQTKEIGDLL